VVKGRDVGDMDGLESHLVGKGERKGEGEVVVRRCRLFCWWWWW